MKVSRKIAAALLDDMVKSFGVDFAKYGSDVTARHYVEFIEGKIKITPISDEEFYVNYTAKQKTGAS